MIDAVNTFSSEADALSLEVANTAISKFKARPSGEAAWREYSQALQAGLGHRYKGPGLVLRDHITELLLVQPEVDVRAFWSQTARGRIHRPVGTEVPYFEILTEVSEVIFGVVHAIVTHGTPVTSWNESTQIHSDHA